MPSRRMLRRAGLAVAVAALLSFQGATLAAPTRSAADADVLATFDELEAAIAALPASVLDRGPRTSLLKKLENAESAYARGQACTAANVLGAYLNETSALRKGSRAAVAEGLHARGRSLRDLVRSRALPSEPCYDGSIGAEPAVAVLASDNERFSARVSFGAPIEPS